MSNENTGPIGSSLDELLEQDDLLSEVTSLAHKRILAWQFREAMEEKHISTVEMAKLMHTSRASLSRLLDPENPSVTLATMDRAAAALGKRLNISLS